MNLNYRLSRRQTSHLNAVDGFRHRTPYHADRERLEERARIAQELHDTLLQGFLAASMQLQAAIGQLPDDSPAKPRFGRIAALVIRAIEEGRQAVRGLRSPRREEHDLSLAQALAAIPGELSLSPLIQLRVAVMGHGTVLDPLHRENVYRICRESIINAYRHSGGDKVDAELTYLRSGLRISIRDNGRGIDCEELKRKRNNHWGLDGMRERAQRIGARVSVMSRIGVGTEVELFLPAAVSGCRGRD